MNGHKSRHCAFNLLRLYPAPLVPYEVESQRLSNDIICNRAKHSGRILLSDPRVVGHCPIQIPAQHPGFPGAS